MSNTHRTISELYTFTIVESTLTEGVETAPNKYLDTLISVKLTEKFTHTIYEVKTFVDSLILIEPIKRS